MKLLFTLTLVLMLFASSGYSQRGTAPNPAKDSDVGVAEHELQEFYRSYGDDLRLGRREGIADRYDRRGYFRVGNGTKSFVSFEESKQRYLTRWTMPKVFEWKDLTFELLSPVSAAVVGLFDYQGSTGEKATFSYSAVLNKQSNGWRIRIEDESFNILGYTTTTISGDRNTPGTWKYTLTAQPGASVSAHRHSTNMKITVKSGRKFIIMGDLDSGKVQRFDAGSTLVIPANTWHVEWWENETVEEIEIPSPTRTERALPSSPRKPEAKQ